jgi:hypothetical protein
LFRVTFVPRDGRAVGTEAYTGGRCCLRTDCAKPEREKIEKSFASQIAAFDLGGNHVWVSFEGPPEGLGIFGGVRLPFFQSVVLLLDVGWRPDHDIVLSDGAARG